MKKYTDCKETKSLSEFSINKTKTDGLNLRCRLCQSIYFKGYYEKNKIVHMERVKARKKRIQSSQSIKTIAKPLQSRTLEP